MFNCIIEDHWADFNHLGTRYPWVNEFQIS